MMRTTSGQRWRTCLRKATPLVPGMRWSHSSTATGSRSSKALACSALPAVSTRKSSSRVRRIASCERSSSSTTSTVGSGLRGKGGVVKALGRSGNKGCALAIVGKRQTNARSRVVGGDRFGLQLQLGLRIRPQNRA